MSFWGRLFGSSKAAEKVIDNVSMGIDKIWYTSEEKAEDAAQARREGYTVYMKWLESTSGSRVARRMIAFIVVTPWALEHIGSVIMGQVAIFADDPSKYLDSAIQLAQSAESNNALVGTVLLFYFAGPVAADGIKGMITKWVDKPNRSQNLKSLE